MRSTSVVSAEPISLQSFYAPTRCQRAIGCFYARKAKRRERWAGLLLRHGLGWTLKRMVRRVACFR